VASPPRTLLGQQRCPSTPFYCVHQVLRFFSVGPICQTPVPFWRLVPGAWRVFQWFFPICLNPPFDSSHSCCEITPPAENHIGFGPFVFSLFPQASSGPLLRCPCPHLILLLTLTFFPVSCWFDVWHPFFFFPFADPKKAFCVLCHFLRGPLSLFPPQCFLTDLDDRVCGLVHVCALFPTPLTLPVGAPEMRFNFALSDFSHPRVVRLFGPRTRWSPGVKPFPRGCFRFRHRLPGLEDPTPPKVPTLFLVVRLSPPSCF